MEYTIENLKKAMENSDHSYDMEEIEKAYTLANEAHQGQTRLSGEPYVIHPLAVAYILVDLGMDSESIIAALLHDVVEDTSVSSEEIRKQFGESVELLVDGVTKLGKIPLYTEEEQRAENVRKMLLAMSKDVRVIIIKLADRLHNMRTLQFMNPQKQRDKAHETMEIYAPLAHRLGIHSVQDELEDISLRYLDPIAYKEIEDELKKREMNNADYIDEIKNTIAKRLEELSITARIDGRVKSKYGIYRKVYIAGRDWDEIFDIYAIRTIVQTVSECYHILGAIHDLFTPIPKRFKDYISTPKSNMYQSLHTTVIGKEGIPFEIQIRTWEMHYMAEYGIAAHWKYKEGIQGKDDLEDRLAWIRQILENQQDAENPEEFISAIKSDIGVEDVFVFTPNGDVKTLPLGSNVIDFAYSIHSEVGHHMIGAKIDGRIVPLDTQIQTGQVVEIITSKTKDNGPSRDWIKLVKTGEARNKIRAWFKKERREENIQEGKQELEREFRRNRILLPAEQMEEFIESIAKKQHFDQVDNFYSAIGYGGIILSRIMPRIRDKYLKLIKTEQKEELQQQALRPTKASNGIIVEGIDNCLVKFAQCCNPLPGDPVIGFVTRGHGVSVHKKDCINALNSQKNADEAGRWIPVSWEKTGDSNYRSTLDVVSIAREGIVADVTQLLMSCRLPLYEMNARELKNGNANITVTIGIAGVEQLKNIITKLKKLSGVIAVERANK